MSNPKYPFFFLNGFKSRLERAYDTLYNHAETQPLANQATNLRFEIEIWQGICMQYFELENAPEKSFFEKENEILNLTVEFWKNIAEEFESQNPQNFIENPFPWKK